MKKYLARLNSTERRFVVGVMVVVFLVINVLFIWPRFKDWDKVKVQIDQAQKKLQAFQKEIGQKSSYQKQVEELQSEDAAVPEEDQMTEFLRTIQMHAVGSGVRVDGNTQRPTVTNQFFLERAQSLSVQAGEPQLVDFLYRLGAGNSMIRVRGLTLRPDPPRFQLTASITLVASYQKKTATRAPAKTADANSGGPAVASVQAKPPNRKRP
jgi:Tfp pilus assembly protein PilO